MPINPITLDKIEPVVIKNIENKVVDRLVHEIKGAEINRDNKNGNREFDGSRQESAARQFGYFLSKYNIKFEYKVLNDKVKFRVRDKDGKLILETEVNDIEKLLEVVKRETGSIIDVRG